MSVCPVRGACTWLVNIRRHDIDVTTGGMQPPHPGIDLVEVRTPTLPPATHTNTWLVGEGRITVVDPASPWEDEQARLFDVLWERVSAGESVERIFLTHHHHDHVSGAVDLQRRLQELGHQVPIVAHALTAELLADRVPVQETVADGARLDCGGRVLEALHTPGHAPGHLVLHDLESGVMIAGDMVAGVGTIVLDPTEGDLQHYLDSLQRMEDRDPTALLPAHGPVLEHPRAVLSFYRAHRNSRSDQIRVALGQLGQSSPLELAPEVYPELPPEHHPLAAAQILTHLRWLRDHGLAVEDPGTGRWAAA